MKKKIHLYNTTAEIVHTENDDVFVIDRFNKSDIRPDMPITKELCKIHTFRVETVYEKVADAYEKDGWTKSVLPKSQSGLETVWRVEMHVALSHELQDLVDRFVRPHETRADMLESVRLQHINRLEKRDRDIETLKGRVLNLRDKQQDFLNAPWYKRVWIALTANRR